MQLTVGPSLLIRVKNYYKHNRYLYVLKFKYATYTVLNILCTHLLIPLIIAGKCDDKNRCIVHNEQTIINVRVYNIIKYGST